MMFRVALCVLFCESALAFQSAHYSAAHQSLAPINAETDTDANEIIRTLDKGESSRRLFMAGATFSLGTALSPALAMGDDRWWEQSPINKRSGVTVSDAEAAGYNVSFVTYLTRFLLCFDPATQRFWFSSKNNQLSKAKRNEAEEIRLKQFAALSASVEVGLQTYTGSQGPARLLEDLLQRYGNETNVLASSSNSDEVTQKRQRREVKEARRQIALLFGLLQKNQPTKELTQLLAAVDNGSVQSVELLSDQAGTYRPQQLDDLQVVFPPPQAGQGYDSAQGTIRLDASNGTVLGVSVVDGGSGYSKQSPPLVRVTKPSPDGVSAVLKAQVGSNGSIEGVVIVEAGSGYSETNPPVVQVVRQEDNVPVGSSDAQLMVELGYPIQSIEMTSSGGGYAMEKPIKVSVKGKADSSDTDNRVIGIAYPKAEKNSYSSFRKKDDSKTLEEIENSFDQEYGLKSNSPISATISGPDSGLPPLPFWTSQSSASELVKLLPAGVGLEYDKEKKRYVLAVDGKYAEANPNAYQTLRKRIDPEFGPRGRAPIERDMDLDWSTYARFWASGAVCASSVHLALTPLDVVKTKVQTAPDSYPTITASFQKVLEEEGFTTFFTGWLPTVVGNFASGGILYTLTELIRRNLSEAAGADAVTYEALIILAAAACASAAGAALICPFEAVRIRTVAQPQFASNSVETCKRMIREEGIGSLVNAIPVFMAKNIPYACAKFLVFDLSTEKLLETFPAANEDLKLSLLVTLVGGILGGTAAAIVSNPADAVISEMKKDKSDISPPEAAQKLIDRSGLSGLFTGLPLRILFYSLIASLTFVVYDGVRFALGIGPDDLKLYLDVLGGALQDGEGII